MKLVAGLTDFEAHSVLADQAGNTVKPKPSAVYALRGSVASVATQGHQANTTSGWAICKQHLIEITCAAFHRKGSASRVKFASVPFASAISILTVCNMQFSTLTI